MKNTYRGCVVALASIFAAGACLGQSKTPEQIVDDVFHNFPATVTESTPENFNSVTEPDLPRSTLFAIAAKNKFELCGEYKIPTGRTRALPAEDVATVFPAINFVTVFRTDTEGKGDHQSWQYLYATHCH